jgi:hypothetical protein
LYLPNNDILVKPPSFMFPNEASIKEDSSKIILNNLDELKNILRGRRLKLLTARKKEFQNEDQETVAKLSEFKPQIRLARQSLSRKYTFRRSLSSRSNDHSMSPSPKKIEDKPSIALTLQTIANVEKSKVKDIEAEMQKFTENNKDYEIALNSKMKNMTKEIEKTSELVSKYKLEISNLVNQKKTAQKNYEETLNEITIKETNHALSMHSVKGKKKASLDVTEEREYFIVKESLRKSKRDLHENYVETIEKIQSSLDNFQTALELHQQHKRSCQKELKDLQESLINFYCMNLKEGMDLREDGIRWTIKALWNMKQAVPISTFPRYLDDESSYYLLSMAEKDLEISMLKDRLKELREEIKKDNLNSSFGKTPLELYDIVKERLRDIKQKSRAVPKLSAEIHENLTTSDMDLSFTRYDEIRSIKNKLKDEEKYRNFSTQEEVKRIVTNYQADNTLGVGLLHIIKALVGDKHRDFRKLAISKPGKKTE